MPGNPSNMSYFRGSIVVTVIAVALGFLYGYFAGGGFNGAVAEGLAQGVTALIATAVLCVLEITLSFDNAIVNAGILQNWSKPWRHAFLVFGILVAVLGMRLIFPVVIVAISAHLSIPAVTALAFQHPTQYAEVLTSSKYMVEAFGAAFLMMIWTEFFFDSGKDVHWIGAIESQLVKLGQIEAVQALFSLSTVLLVAQFLAPVAERMGFIVAGVLGVVAFIASKALATILGGEQAEAGEKAVQASIGGFLYLELLDSSFSFDGVIGAFAITTSLPIIMLGLGAGAYWVRSMTVWLVDHDKLVEFRYLGHGAYWAIAVLDIIMFAAVRYEVPNVVTGLIGAVFVGAAFFASLRANKQDALLATSAA